MRIVDVLRVKGSDVLTFSPDGTVAELLAVLGEHRVGALIVSADGESIDGIVSERDIVRSLAARGADLLACPASEIMTSDVVTCEPEASLVDLLAVMTDRRFRHVPVVDGSRLAGIVSIGDIVKFRLDELRSERDFLESYIHT